MHKPKPPRHSRLIRKWDGTPVSESDVTTNPSAGNVSPAAPTPADHSREPGDLVFEFEREDELSDTLER